MRVITEEINLKTEGAGDLIDITASLKEKLDDSGLREGNVTVFVVGSTAAITSFEYEPGLIKDMTALYEKLAPEGKPYAHDRTWGDAAIE